MKQQYSFTLLSFFPLFMVSLCTYTPAALAQESFFSKTYDLVGYQGADRGVSVRDMGEGFVISAASSCDGGSNACTGIIKTDYSGEAIWKTLNNDYPMEVRPAFLADLYLRMDTLYYAGTRSLESEDEVEAKMYIAKMDWNDGTLLAVNEFGNSTFDRAGAFKSLGDNQWLVYGASYPGNRLTTALTITDIEGNPETVNYLEYPFPSFMELEGDMERLPNGRFVVTAETRNPTLPQRKGMVVAEVDSLANIIWYRHFDDNLVLGCNNQLAPLHNGDIAIAYCADTVHDSSPFNSIWADKIMVLDSTGQTKWEHFFHAPTWKLVRNITTARNGDIIGCGTDGSYGYPDGEIRLSVFVFRMSPEGEVLWERRFITDATHQWAQSIRLDDVHETEDGRIAAVGYQTELFPDGAPNGNVWLLVLDERGCLVPGCEASDYMITGPTTVVGTQQVEAIEEYFQVFPQPASDWLTARFSLPPPARSRLRLYNALGQVAAQEALAAGARTHTMDTAALSAGLHVLVLEGPDGQVLQSQKVIINK